MTDKVQKCDGDMEVYSRVVGFYRPVKQWNGGKAAEYQDRQEYKAEINERYTENGE